MKYFLLLLMVKITVGVVTKESMLSCQPGFYGNNCHIPCPSNCHSSTDDGFVRCGKEDGFCTHGCKKTWFGPSCNKTCIDGCSDRECFQLDGRCTGRCQDGWSGIYCNHTCLKCKTRCSRKGDCKLGCKAGWKGSSCNIKCMPDCDECRQYEQICLRCRSGYHENGAGSCSRDSAGDLEPASSLLTLNILVVVHSISW